MAVIADQLPQQIHHPFRGQSVDVNDIDALATMYEMVHEEMQRLKDVEYAIRHRLGVMATSDKKSRRLQGNSVTVKIVDPDDYWSQSILKEVVQNYGVEAMQYLRIATYAANMREIKKLEGTSGTDEFEAMRELILSARSPGKSPPRVSVER